MADYTEKKRKIDDIRREIDSLSELIAHSYEGMFDDDNKLFYEAAVRDVKRLWDSLWDIESLLDYLSDQFERKINEGD